MLIVPLDWLDIAWAPLLITLPPFTLIFPVPFLIVWKLPIIVPLFTLTLPVLISIAIPDSTNFLYVLPVLSKTSVPSFEAFPILHQMDFFFETSNHTPNITHNVLPQ